MASERLAGRLGLDARIERPCRVRVGDAVDYD